MNNILLVGCGNLGKIVLDGLLLENKKVYLLEKNQNITKKINHKNCIIIKKIEDQVLEKGLYNTTVRKTKSNKRDSY